MEVIVEKEIEVPVIQEVVVESEVIKEVEVIKEDARYSQGTRNIRLWGFRSSYLLVMIFH